MDRQLLSVPTLSGVNPPLTTSGGALTARPDLPRSASRRPSRLPGAIHHARYGSQRRPREGREGVESITAGEQELSIGLLSTAQRGSGNNGDFVSIHIIHAHEL